ncbi:MAG TPA: ATP-dependent Clp protease ATP-binding subunit [Patescibacteria group bacterium]|nr:ATP-dependent Clp protease ATP-binding subunit [Patescibacteria group bacterium]
MLNIFQKFSAHSRNALKKAFDLALTNGHKAVTPKHLLCGLSQETGSIGAQILAKTKIKTEDIESDLRENQANNPAVTQISLAINTKKLLEKSVLISSVNRHRYIGTEHLLLALISLNDPELNDFFQKKNIDLGEIKRQTETILNSTSKFPDFSQTFNYPANEEESDFYQNEPQTETKAPSFLDVFAVNLTDKTIQNNIDPVIGRNDEINRLIQILCRRHKNNPLLLGDPGVGKTAIIEGLAKKIIDRAVPALLQDKLIYQLDLSLIVAGTSFRGEFENRLKQIILEVKKNPNIILFIDEVHNIIGAGSATGSMDAANILKPALARGEIRCLGATTLEDYKKHIETDPALERRFQPILVNQPSVKKTIEILAGIKHNYEIYHQVKITDEAITAAAALSERYITERFLPDKAIDLIDEASAAIRLTKPIAPAIKELNNLEIKLKETWEKKKEAVTKEKFNLALNLQKQEKELQGQIKDLKNQNLENSELPEITKNEIIAVVSKITGIPLNDLILGERKRLLNLEGLLAKKIIGQDAALASVAEFIRRARTGITDLRRPLGSFIFLGPSGVGKTELARVLAEVVFGSPQALVKIDMSEFAESFNISKLIGAPAGYVGYKEGAKLTDAVKRRPYCVVLFDEIEKAHHQVFNLMLQILEDGFLTDGTGKMINFKNTIIILTSNLGSEKFNTGQTLGFAEKNSLAASEKQKWQEVESEVVKKLQDKFPPEFLSRLDKTIVFKPLGQSSLIKISQLQLDLLKERLNNQGVELIIDPQVAKFIGQISLNLKVGARAVRKNIIDLVESKIAEKLLNLKKTDQKIIGIKILNDKIAVSN